MTAYVAAALIADRSRWFLWVPVWLGAGAAVYFAIGFEPEQWMGLAVLAVTAALFLATHLLRASLSLRLPLAIALLLAAGFAVAQERTIAVARPVLNAAAGPETVTGRVLDVEPGAEGARVTMDHVSTPSLQPAQTPERIHLRLTKYSIVPDAGSVIKVRAVLMPPAGPAAPDAHDFRRDLYFEHIGGVGYAMGKPRVVETADLRPGEARMEKLRQFISRRVTEVLGQTPEAAIAIAYMTGERGLIDPPTADNMRNSGLAHLLALSGMKVGLVAIIGFAACRMLLALVPVVALRINGRKIAAVVGIAGALTYVLIAAAPVPALRSLLMTGMAMTAILFDRQSFSLRLAAIAACVVILWQPESVTGVSFQMSFGAVIALISFYEAMRSHISAAYSHSGRSRRFMLGFGKLLVTTLVATLVTSPLALFHFQQEANYSVVANAIAIPLNDFWIMPCGVVAMLLMPFGLDHWALLGMGRGIGWMLDVAHTVSRWPGAVTHVPALPDISLVLLELGGLWIILWRGRWRRLGIVGVMAGLIAATFHSTPDVLVSEDGKRVAFRMNDGLLAVNKIGKHDFTVDTWDRMNALRGLALMPDTGDMDGTRIDCDAGACTFDALPAHRVVHLRDESALAQWCQHGTILISELDLAGACPEATVIDGAMLAHSGAVALYQTATGYHMNTVTAQTGRRPWAPRN